MRFIGGLFALGVYGFFAGIIFIAAIFWWHSQGLPNAEQLAKYQPATLSRVHSGDGALIAEFVRERRLYTPIDEIPELVKHAFISAEDKNFYEHSGVDGLGLIKAMIDNFFRAASGRRLRGASTITQQVVKNFLLSGEKAVSRKIKEAILAQRLEGVLNKEQILELYLSEIYFGNRAYGVTSAARRYFDKRLDELTPAEVAYLAALPKAPSTLHPVKAKQRATDRRNYVLREMLQNGYIDQAAYDEAVATELDTVLDDPDDSDERGSPKVEYFAEEIRRQLVDQFGEDEVYGGGLSIRATMDPKLQDLARRALQKRLFDYSQDNGYDGPAATLENVDPENEADWRERLAKLDIPRDVSPWKRAVVLLVGERSAQIGIEGVESAEPIYLPFNDVKGWAAPHKGYNSRGHAIKGDTPKKPSDVWSLGDVIYVEKVKDDEGERWSMRQIPDVNGAVVAMDPHTGRVLALQGGFSYDASVFNRATQAKRQPGSSFKPFVYAAALEHGYQPNTIVLDAPVTLEQREGDTWKPTNYSGKFYGPSPMRVGLEKSQNLMTVRIAMDVSLETVAGYAEKFGVYDKMPPLVSYALGAGETTLLRMASSYAMFVNGGKRIEPTLIDRIQDRHGKTIYRHDDRICAECRAEEWNDQPEPYVPDEGEQVMDPVTAYQVVWMLNGVTTRGTAAKVGRALDFPVGGKTGTTNEARDAWFIGFTPDLVVGCYIGFDNPHSLGSHASGGALCSPVFIDFMKEAMKDKKPVDFRRPTGVTMVKVDRGNGCAVGGGSEGNQFIWEAFRSERAPTQGECPPGGIIGAASGFDAAINRALLSDNGGGGGGASVSQTGANGGTIGVAPAPPTIGSGSGGLY